MPLFFVEESNLCRLAVMCLKDLQFRSSKACLSIDEEQMDLIGQADTILRVIWKPGTGPRNLCVVMAMLWRHGLGVTNNSNPKQLL